VRRMQDLHGSPVHRAERVHDETHKDVSIHSGR
jgi:hypothetical protein